MKSLLAIAVGFSLLAGYAHAADPAEQKHAAVLQLMDLVGSTKMANQMMDQMMSAIKGSGQNVPEEFFTVFKEKAQKSSFIDLIVPIYEKYYTLEELNTIIAFYKTPVGQKVLTTMPQVMQESMQIGQQWGQKLGMEAMQEVQARQAAKAGKATK